MKKLKSFLALLAAAALVFTLAACEQASDGDDTDYGAAPPANLVGTWEGEVNFGFGAAEMTVKIEASGKVTMTTFMDMTTMVQMSAALSGMTEAEVWASMQEDQVEPGTTFSTSTPWTMTSVQVSLYEEMSSEASITVSGNTMTVVTTEVDDETGEETEMTMTFTRVS